MKLLVTVNRVVDHTIRVRLKPRDAGLDPTDIRVSMDPLDEIAIEEALRLKSIGKVSDVVVLSIGPASARKAIRAALAMGADRGILVETGDVADPLAMARILKAVVCSEKPGLLFLGKPMIDDDFGITGQMVAALLGWPQGTSTSPVRIDGRSALITRKVDRGLQTVRIALPAIITTDFRVNEARAASASAMMAAKKKPLAVKSLTDLGLGSAPPPSSTMNL